MNSVLSCKRAMSYIAVVMLMSSSHGFSISPSPTSTKRTSTLSPFDLPTIQSTCNQHVNTFSFSSLRNAVSDEDAIDSEEKKVQVSSFRDLGLSPQLLISIDAQNWKYPTPIQSLCIPSILSFASSSGGSSESDIMSVDDDTNSIWAEAPTGSGKTAAFALPLVQLIMARKRDIRQRQNLARDHSDRATGNGITSLILSPTRELALQIAGVFEEIVEGMSSTRHQAEIEIQVITGGTPLEPQIEKLARRKTEKQDVDILIATPGRLVDVLMNSKRADTKEVELEKKLLKALDAVGGKDVSLSLEQLNELKINESIASGDDGGRAAIEDMAKSVQYLILDEADRLLSHGFRNEMNDVMKLLPHTKDSNAMKVCLFSASFPPEIEPRVDSFLRGVSNKKSLTPLRLSCLSETPEVSSSNADDEELSSRQKKRQQQTTKPSAVLQGPASTIDLRSIRIDEKDRTQALIHLINSYGKEQWDRVLVFVATRYSAEHVSKKLRRKNIRASELHGKLDFNARKRRLDDFKKGKIQVLIATDLASRGLDIRELPAVVNYDLPRSAADFIHRVGRTGRAGSKGTAITYITPTNQKHFELIEKRYFNGRSSIEKEVLHGFEPNEEKWDIKEAASELTRPGVRHSKQGLVHDKMFGGVKGRRKSKKDKLREKQAKDLLKAQREK